MSAGIRWAMPIMAFEAFVLAAALVTPMVRESARHQTAHRAAREINIICSAAATAGARTGQWPPDEAPGSVPAALKSLLPAKFSFTSADYQLDWDHWTLSEGVESYSRVSQFQGVSITVHDPKMLREVVKALPGDRAHFTVGDRTTIVIPDTGPRLQ